MSTDQNAFMQIDPVSVLSRIRRGLLWGGIVMVLLGCAALIMPMFSTFVIETLIGWLLTVSGVVSVVGAFSLRGTGLFIWELLAGLLTLAAGLLLLLFPLQGQIALTVLVAIVLLLTGGAQFAFALWSRPVPGWGWGIFSAIISIALGVHILFVLTEASAVILGLLVGIDFVSTGTALMLISRSFPKADEV